MIAPARLLSVRMLGFKSFADRTVVDFGPGISAIVGPNGSGKSNLADALRWTLGEQGRALRARRSEDVVWAGSERRAATGMADVTLMLDNADGLLPVDYGVVELGRRLYRSGENEYLLNRTRVRLRDLVDLLDAAHLADNAFLFIGQGMVDQALALRPEERRPLFEEVAGVRRHERRRRRADEQLTEAGANLARVRDVLAELRPQARRLAAQAEQQAARRSSGDDLANALMDSAHHRWHAAATREQLSGSVHRAAQGSVDAALTALGDAEAAVLAASADLTASAEAEGLLLASLDAALARLTDLRLADGRMTSDRANEERELDRARAELAAAEGGLETARGAAVEPVPAPDAGLEAVLGAAERAVVDADAEVAALRATEQVHDAARDAVRRAIVARQAERETARRMSDETAHRAAEQRDQAEAARVRRAAGEARLAEIGAALEAAVVGESDTATARRLTRASVEAAEAAHSVAVSRVAELDQRIRSAQARIVPRVAVAVSPTIDGSPRLADRLEVEPAWRQAVAAALAEALDAPIVSRATLRGFADVTGTAIVSDADGTADRQRDVDRAFHARVVETGGGMLGDAVRRDPSGVGRVLLARSGWAPDLATALDLQPDMPVGWTVTTRDGSATVGPLVVALEPERDRLERRAEEERLGRAVAAMGAELKVARRELTETAAALEAARSDEVAAIASETRSSAARQRLEEEERSAGREAETATRDVAWHEAQLIRVEADERRAREALDEAEAVDDEKGPAGAAEPARVEAIETWEGRARELRATRDRLVEERSMAEAARRAAEGRRAVAAAAVASMEERITRLNSGIAGRVEAIATLTAQRESQARELAAAAAIEADLRQRAERLRAGSADGRARLAAAERGASTAREALRRCEDTLRSAELADVEARLALDGVREALLVDLAAMGEVGLERLRRALPAGVDLPVSDDDAAVFEAALAAIGPTWATDPPTGEPPTAARLAALRRRFHELGATNPFADQEYAEIKDRLDGLENQESDLQDAIEGTRRLIVELSGLIADQFRTTFQALESSFDRRFRQLFGGGFARLELTEPADLSATGVEIIARPPGKKSQALAMLSGGERALTAVALLFAMLEVRPVPFCVLDEVDAALDEANIGRFTDALTDLARETQFIVITHNRGTIEVADALYGVTVGDDSVSRVISLRLDEAAAIAEERRADRATRAAAVGSS